MIWSKIIYIHLQFLPIEFDDFPVDFPVENATMIQPSTLPTVSDIRQRRWGSTRWDAERRAEAAPGGRGSRWAMNHWLVDNGSNNNN